MYDYRETMAEDIRAYIVDNDIDVTTENREEVENNLQEELWIADGITGNANGSYTFSRRMAQEYVMDNIDILDEACSEFGTEYSTIGEKFLAEDWEWMDVTIRCYLLYSVLGEVLDELEHEPEEQEDGTDYNWETHSAADLQ